MNSFIRIEVVSSESLRRRTLKWSHIEAGFFSLMVGSAETFAIYFAIKRGVSQEQAALLQTLPVVLGSIANWLVPMLIPQKFLKKGLCAMVGLQVIGLFLLIVAFLQKDFMPMILVALSLYWMGGMAAGPLWLDWISGWLPKDRMGRYLSRRNAYTSLVTVCTYLVLAYLLFWEGSHVAPPWIFVVGFLARSFSLGLLMIQANPMPRGDGNTVSVSHRSHAAAWSRARRSKVLIAVSVAAICFKFAQMLSSPFTVTYTLNELHFGLMDYAWLTAIPFIARALFLASWGEAVRSFNPFVGLQIAMVALSGSCFLWTMAHTPFQLCATEFISGIFWGGFDLCIALIFQNFAPGYARSLVGFHLLLMNLVAMAGGYLGSKILAFGMSSVELFQISAELRLAVALCFVFVLLRFKDTRTSFRVYTEFLWSALSLRPSLSNIGRIIPLRKA